MRNRELKTFLVCLAVLTLIGGGLLFALDPAAGLVGSCFFLALDLTCLLFTRRRYQNLKALAAALHAICAGDYSLDVRDNREGELSLLKNEVYKVTHRLLEQSEQLRKEKRALADALSDISHQLKTPLTSLRVMADLIQAEPEAERRRECTQRLQAQLTRMEGLLAALLKLSSLDAGVVRLNRERLPLLPLLQQAAQPLLIPMELKEQSFSLNVQEGAGFVGDAVWTREALTNLIKNCMEHTPRGGRIVVTCQENPLHTEVTIQDSGPGFAPGDLPHLFERFFRGQNASGEGVGIGLNLAKAVLTRQNAQISAENAGGGGARFVIRFYKQII